MANIVKIGFFSDTHYGGTDGTGKYEDAGYTKAKRAIDELINIHGVSALVYAGDMIYGAGGRFTDAGGDGKADQLYDLLSGNDPSLPFSIPYLFAVGNHDVDNFPAYTVDKDNVV
ncbi:unnamed protein product, partial [marine sediment metagenome]